ncbi:hypothetical protein V8E55_008906 [Tylopilus felleus]
MPVRQAKTMFFDFPTGPKFELLPLLVDDPFEFQSSTITIQDLLYDMRLSPLMRNYTKAGYVPTNPFVVTEVTYYKEKSTRFGHQHAYVLLKIQPHPSRPQPSWSHTFIRVSAEHKRNPLLTHLGLYFDAEAGSTIVDGPAITDKVNSTLSWAPEQAPMLSKLKLLILKTHLMMEWGWFKSCHIFAAAIMDAVHTTFGDVPESLKSHPFIYHPYSFEMNYAARIADRAVTAYKCTVPCLWYLDHLVD